MSALASHVNRLPLWQRRDLLAAIGGLGEIVRRHDDNVRPDGLAEHFVAADDSHLVADTFLDGFCNLVDRQPIGIDHGLLRSHQHSHFPALFWLSAANQRSHECAILNTPRKAQFAQRWHFLDSQNRNSRWVHDGTSGQPIVPVGELA
jgi:hypothetical protein